MRSSTARSSRTTRATCWWALVDRWRGIGAVLSTPLAVAPAAFIVYHPLSVHMHACSYNAACSYNSASPYQLGLPRSLKLQLDLVVHSPIFVRRYITVT